MKAMSIRLQLRKNGSRQRLRMIFSASSRPMARPETRAAPRRASISALLGCCHVKRQYAPPKLQIAIVTQTPKRTVAMRKRTSQRSTMRTGSSWLINVDIGPLREELSGSAQRKLCNALDVRCLGEHVDRTYAVEHVPRIRELARVWGERGGVAGDVDDAPCARLDHPPHDLL